MKKAFKILLLSLLICAVLGSTAAFADTIYDQGYFKYKLEDGGITIVLYFGKEEVVDVPNQISGTPVSKIAAGAFTNCPEVRVVNLPDTIMEVEDGAFSGNIAVNYSAIIPDWNKGEEPSPEDPTEPGSTGSSEPVVLPGGTVDITDQIESDWDDFEETEAAEQPDTETSESVQATEPNAATGTGTQETESASQEATTNETAEGRSSAVAPATVVGAAVAAAAVILIRRKKR